MSRVDPLGLWSVTFEGYAGVGGGMTVGRDPTTGKPFMTLRAGWGISSGFKWYKKGERPYQTRPTRARVTVQGLACLPTST